MSVRCLFSFLLTFLLYCVVLYYLPTDLLNEQGTIEKLLRKSNNLFTKHLTVILAYVHER